MHEHDIIYVIIKVIIGIKLVLTSMTRHVEFLKRTMSIILFMLIIKIATLRIRLVYPRQSRKHPKATWCFAVVVIPLDAV